MRKQLVLHGVPDSIRQDGWWLSCSSETADTDGGFGTDEPPALTKTMQQRHKAILALLALVLLADWLFWHHEAGISVALFAMALAVVIMVLKAPETTRREWLLMLGFQLLCNLPMVEQLQLLSLLFTLVGIIALVVWVAYERIIEWWQALWAFVRLSIIGSTFLTRDAISGLKRTPIKAKFRQHAASLILPGGIGLVFLVLLTTANPLLEQLVNSLLSFEFMTEEQIRRLFFWFIVASLLWPYLNLPGRWLGPVAKARALPQVQAPWVAHVVNEASVRQSLALFNLMFLVQTVMDLGVLTGGVGLPEGLSYAEYAHRGAYPLVATALLAGVFAIATHRMIRHSPALRVLLYLWLGQNLFLVITAAFRLQLYVEAYSLTYLRVAAFIWMGLVFVGLVLIIVQIQRGHSISWLVRRNLCALGGVLYACCFVNFAYVIADYNLRHAPIIGGIDTEYVCSLGQPALPLILEQEDADRLPMCTSYFHPMPRFDPIDTWREWGFRQWRLQVYLADRYHR